MIKKTLLSLSLAGWLTFGVAASAQVPVIDTATLTQATQTARNTAQIMNSNQQILNTVNRTLAAVTGNRSTGGLSSIGLGGFSLSSAPNLSSLLGGGSLSMGGLGSYGSLASSIINGLNLVKTLTGASSAASTTESCLHGSGQHLRRDHRRGVGRSGRLNNAVVGLRRGGGTDRLRARHQRVDRSELANPDPDGSDDQRADRHGQSDERVAQRPATAGSRRAIEAVEHVDLQCVAGDAGWEVGERRDENKSSRDAPSSSPSAWR